MSALRDLAVSIRRLNGASPELQNLDSMRRLFQLMRQRAVDAIAEDDAILANSAKYRTGGADTPPNPCLVYLKMVAPDPDIYQFAAPDGASATLIVKALNALPPGP